VNPKGQINSPDNRLRRAGVPREAANDVSVIEDTHMQDSFPAYRRVLEMVHENLLNEDPLRKLFCSDTLKKAKLSDAVWMAYAFRNCGDPGFSATADFNKKLCSAETVEALNSFRWVDQGLRIFCDEPCPHLLADLLLGLYGFPYHCNVSKQRRWHYVAAGKVTPMYLDVFVLDQARYFYDLVPTLGERVGISSRSRLTASHVPDDVQADGTTFRNTIARL
jgi:hypothetical protein